MKDTGWGIGVRTWRWVTQQEEWMGSFGMKEERVKIHAHEEQPHVTSSGWDSPGLTGRVTHKTFTDATGIVVPNTHPIKIDFGVVRVVSDE